MSKIDERAFAKINFPALMNMEEGIIKSQTFGLPDVYKLKLKSGATLTEEELNVPAELEAESLAYCMLQIEACNIIILNKNKKSLDETVLSKKAIDVLGRFSKFTAGFAANNVGIDLDKSINEILADVAKKKIESLCAKIEASLEFHSSKALQIFSDIMNKIDVKENTEELIEKLKKELAVIQKFGNFSTAIGEYQYEDKISPHLPPHVTEMLNSDSQQEAPSPVTVHMPIVEKSAEVKPEEVKTETEVASPPVTIHLSDPPAGSFFSMFSAVGSAVGSVLKFVTGGSPTPTPEYREKLIDGIYEYIKNKNFIEAAKSLKKLNVIIQNKNVSDSGLNEIFAKELNLEISKRIKDDEFLRNSNYREETKSLLQKFKDPNVNVNLEKEFYERVEERKKAVDELIKDVGNAIAKNYIEKETLKEYASGFSSRCLNLGEKGSDVIKKSYEKVKYLTDVYDRISQLSQELKDPGIPSDEKEAKMQMKKSLADFLSENFKMRGIDCPNFNKEKEQFDVYDKISKLSQDLKDPKISLDDDDREAKVQMGESLVGFLNEKFGYVGAEFPEFAEKDKKEQKTENLSNEQSEKKNSFII